MERQALVHMWKLSMLKTLTISQPEPDAKPAENEDVLLKKSPRQTRKKWNVGR